MDAFLKAPTADEEIRRLAVELSLPASSLIAFTENDEQCGQLMRLCELLQRRRLVVAVGRNQEEQQLLSAANIAEPNPRYQLTLAERGVTTQEEMKKAVDGVREKKAREKARIAEQKAKQASKRQATNSLMRGNGVDRSSQRLFSLNHQDHLPENWRTDNRFVYIGSLTSHGHNDFPATKWTIPSNLRKDPRTNAPLLARLVKLNYQHWLAAPACPLKDDDFMELIGKSLVCSCDAGYSTDPCCHGTLLLQRADALKTPTASTLDPIEEDI